jgi:cell division septation protein DedD
MKPFKEVFLYRFNGCSYEKGPVGNFSGDRPFYIQLAAFEKYQSANELTKELSTKGYPAYCEFQKPDEGNSFFRVRIGTYGSAAEADRILNKIKNLGYDGFISQN